MAARGKSRFFHTAPSEAKPSARKLLSEDFATVVTSQEPLLRAIEWPRY